MKSSDYGYESHLKIFKKEFASFFQSPIAYIIMVVFLAFQGWFFVRTYYLSGIAEMRQFFMWMPLIFALIIPAVTMRLFAEEKSTGSWEILITLPLNLKEIILGKFLSVLAFVCVMLLPTFFYVVMAAASGDLDPGPVIGGYIGTVFLGGAFAAVGMFASSLSKNQIIGFVIALAICIFFWIIGKVLPLLPQAFVNFLQHLSTDYHFDNISKGVIDFRDILYFITISFIFLYATWFSMNEKSSS